MGEVGPEAARDLEWDLDQRALRARLWNSSLCGSAARIDYHCLLSYRVSVLTDERQRYGLERDEARRLRRTQSNTEYVLWSHLRARKFRGLKFRRQHPLGPYIVDFCCIDRQIVIELDGSQHLENAKYDARRTEFLNAHDYRVIRFWNHEVLTGMEHVPQMLEKFLSEELP